MAFQLPGRFRVWPIVTIAVIVSLAAGLFAYAAGWLSPHRLSPAKIVAELAPPGGPALGHRRNHVKGICFTGTFESNGHGALLSVAPMLVQGTYPVIGRFNLGTADPAAAEASVRVRGMGLQISTANGQVWRSAMIDAPFFPVATPEAFYALLLAPKSGNPAAMKNFMDAHPEFAVFLGWAKSAPWTGSYAEEPYNSIDSFVFTAGDGTKRTVRWSFLPEAEAVSIPPADLQKKSGDFLEQEIAERIQRGPLRWRMQVTVAAASDTTNDPSKAWPASRQKVEVGTLVVQAIEPEQSGPCRDLNFDPTVLPSGVTVSDDPFPAARSAAYRVSYDLRAAEEKYYPEGKREAQP